MKHASVIMILLAAFSFVFALPLAEIPNMRGLQDDIFTSGQPSEEGFKQLAAMGIKTVINVLPERNCVKGEAEMVVSNQMVYRTVPFKTSGFRKETIEYFAETLKKAEKPVLIHCGTGNHVGGLWFAYRILVQDAPLEVALMEGRVIGMKKELEEDLVVWVMQNR